MIKTGLDFNDNDLFPDKRKFLCHYCGKKKARAIAIEIEYGPLMCKPEEEWETSREVLCFNCGKRWNVVRQPDHQDWSVI